MPESFDLERNNFSKKVEGGDQESFTEKEKAGAVDDGVKDNELQELKEKDAMESIAKVSALLEEMDVQVEKMTRGQFQQSLENATTLDQVIEALEGFAVYGKIESNSPSGAIDLQKAIDAINGGYGQNISDSSVQMAVRRIEEQGEQVTNQEVKVEKMTDKQFEQALENATTLDQIVETLEEFAEDGAIKSNSPAGVLSLSKTVDTIREGYGKNISDSRIQRAVRRIEEGNFSEKQDEKMTREQFEQALEKAITLDQIVEILKGFADGDKIESNSPAGVLSLNKTVEAVRGGYGQNISDSNIQGAVIRIQG